MGLDGGKHDLFLHKGYRLPIFLHIRIPLCPTRLFTVTAAGLCKRQQSAWRGSILHKHKAAIYRKHAETEPPIPGTNRPPELQKPTFTHAGPAPTLLPAARAAIAACRAGRACKFCFVTLAQILTYVLCTSPLVLRSLFWTGRPVLKASRPTTLAGLRTRQHTKIARLRMGCSKLHSCAGNRPAENRLASSIRVCPALATMSSHVERRGLKPEQC